MLLSLSNKLFGRDEVDDASSSVTAARLTALSSVPVTSMVIDDGLLTDFPASSSPDDDLPRWLTGDCAVPRLARDIFALILAPDSCDPDSRTGKPSSEVALACHLVKSGLPLLSSSFLRPTYYAVSQSNRECLRRREIKARFFKHVSSPFFETKRRGKEVNLARSEIERREEKGRGRDEFSLSRVTRRSRCSDRESC